MGDAKCVKLLTTLIVHSLNGCLCLNKQNSMTFLRCNAIVIADNMYHVGAWTS